MRPSETEKIKRKIIEMIRAENEICDLVYALLRSATGIVAATKGHEEAERVFHQLAAVFASDPGKRLQDMTEPELHDHINDQIRFIKAGETADTIGSMLVIFQDDGITQYGSTIDPETAPAALRELADRIERRETVKRGHKWN